MHTIMSALVKLWVYRDQKAALTISPHQIEYLKEDHENRRNGRSKKENDTQKVSFCFDFVHVVKAPEGKKHAGHRRMRD